MSASRRRASWLLAASAASGLLLFNVGARVHTYVLGAEDQGWRGWDDLAVASGYAERRDFPVAPYVLGNRYRRKSDEFMAFRHMVTEGTAAAGLRPTRFWQPLPAGTSRPRERVADRAALRRRRSVGAAGSRLPRRGGVAPFLILWLAPLALVPAFFWTLFELSAAGRLAAGIVFLLALATSAFVVDALTLGYSAVGFYLLESPAAGAPRRVRRPPDAHLARTAAAPGLPEPAPRPLRTESQRQPPHPAGLRPRHRRRRVADVAADAAPTPRGGHWPRRRHRGRRVAAGGRASPHSRGAGRGRRHHPAVRPAASHPAGARCLEHGLAGARRFRSHTRPRLYGPRGRRHGAGGGGARVAQPGGRGGHAAAGAGVDLFRSRPGIWASWRGARWPR